MREAVRTAIVLLISLLSFTASDACPPLADGTSWRSPLSPSGAVRVSELLTDAASSPAPAAYPLKPSANNRYLVDSKGKPFLMVGDAPQALIANLSELQAAEFMTNRRKYGFNTLWINLLCRFPEVCRNDGNTSDAIAPFNVSGDLSTPNSAYFERADRIMDIAKENGFLVLLDPIETAGWLEILRANGVAKDFAFGAYLGERYKKFPNIIWLHGNDFQSWRNPADDRLVRAVAQGIKSKDTSHLHTIELDYLTSASLDNDAWRSLVDLDAAYTYFPTYAQVLAEYNRAHFKPVFLVEANYEFEQNPNTDGGSTQNLRRQEYWTMLSGATGLVYGSAYTWPLQKGWETKLDTPGAVQLCHMRNLFAPRKWYDLVPDQDHTVVTSGYHGIAGYIGKSWAFLRRYAFLDRHKDLIGGSVTTNTFAPAARTPDGTLVMAYLPTAREITVDMTKLAGPSTARWYDPTDGHYMELNGSPFPNSGSRQFASPERNSSGDADWVLVLEVLPPRI